MNMTRICAFSTADDAYIPKAAASLLSIRKWNQAVPLYILSSKISSKNKKLLQSLDIKFIETNLRSTFPKTWEYPLECFYFFAGPELLYAEGFDYSLYIDGDVYCNNDPIIPLKDIKAFAGVVNGRIRDILSDDYQAVTRRWQSTASSNAKRLQSGVVYFNNKALNKFDFLEKAGVLFRESLDASIPRKGDDSLFALFQYVYPQLDYKQLPPAFNFMTANRAENDRLTRNESLIDDAVFYHFTNGFPKPWEINVDYPDYSYKYFSEKWKHRLIDTFSSKELGRCFPQIHKVLTDDHLRFYWWPSENVGDLITPYFLEKAGHIDNLDNYAINEEEIMAIEAGVPPVKRRLFKRQESASNTAKYCVSTGSVIRLCGNRAMVFGSGIRSVDQEVHASHVRSVRGPLTRGRFLDSGFECAPIYGDPGLLLPRFYRPKKSRKKYPLGIAPHFTEYEQVRDLYKDDSDILVIDMGNGDLESVIDSLASCDMTVSSSLHGLVLSHAYGVPTRRIIFSDRINGDGTKYNDYYQGIDFSPLAAIDASGFKKVPKKSLLTLKKETLAFDDARLYDAMFFDENGLRPSARYPY